MTGQPRETRGHHLVGGPLGRGPREERHFAIAALIAGAIGAIVSAYGAYSASQAQAASLHYQEKVNKQQAQAATDAAAAQAQSQREESAHALAHLRSQAGAAGIVTGEGSELLAEMESAGNAKLDEKRILYAGQIRSGEFRQEGVLRGFEARGAQRQGYISGSTSLLAGASRAASGYANLSSGSGGGFYGGSPGGLGSSAYSSYRAGER